MRKRFVLMLCLQSALLLFLCSKAKAQVHNGDLTITTQVQIDAFNFTSITGFLNLDLPASITNIDGLSELTAIGRHLEISNSGLINLDGLSNLTSIGNALLIRVNPALTNLNGLSSLTSLGSAILLQNNPLLTNIDGLSGLTGLIKGIDINNCGLTNLDALINVTSLGVEGFLNLENNIVLTNIDGLYNITGTVGQIKIVNNKVLPNIDGLINITGVAFGDGVLIQNNPLLTNIDGLSNLERVAGDFDIVGNHALTNINGLSSLEEVGRRFDIRANSALTNVDGLINLEEVGRSFFIQENSELTSLDGLSGLTSVGGDLRILSNFELPDLDGLLNLNHVGFNLSIRSNNSLIDFCGLYKLFHSGTIGGTIGIGDNGANTVAITPPDAVIVNNDPGLCSATILDAAVGTGKPVGCLEPFTTLHSDFPAANVFPVGITQITWAVTDGAGNTASAIQTITVTDNQPPVITCPGNITVSCASDVPDVNVNSVTATDNCSAVITHGGDVISNQTCANRFTLTRTYKATDPAGNTATCSQVITVNDNVPPQITGLSISQQVLWPPNHKMQDIILNYTASDNCVGDPLITITVSSNESINGTGDGDTDPDWVIIDNHHVKLRAERAANGTGRIYTITVTVDDGCNPPVSQSKEVMVVHNITAPQSGKPFKIGSTVDFSGEFWNKPGNKHTAKWLIDENTIAKAIVTEPAGNKNGKITGSYKFTSAGVYKLQMNVTDQNGITSYANTNGDLEAIVVIYDPNGGHTYGGGYYDSPAGALSSNPSTTGKASYGFAMNYFKNSTNPKGETQFEFKVGEFEFNALNFDYLVINNTMAQFKGTGKIIGGQSGIGFTMTVTDGQLDGSGVDKIRMKIYNKNNGSIIYDNQPGASDLALPVQAVGTNSTIVISGFNSSLTSANTNQKGEIESKEIKVSNKLDVIVFPNPSAGKFTINVKTNKTEKIVMQVVDMYGRVIETRNVKANSIVRFGDRYSPGTYFARIIQDKEHREIKLVKLSD